MKELLVDLYKYDVNMFCYLVHQWWAWTFFCVPLACYTSFFVIKWVLLTFPIWATISLSLSALRRKCDENKKSDN